MQGIIPGNKKRTILTSRERAQLVVDTKCDPRTIRKWELGLQIRECNRERLEQAASARRYPRPEKGDAT
jgi:hypothetical protein